MIVLTTRLNVMINALMNNMMMIPYLVSLYAIRMINQNMPMIPNATAVLGSLLKIDAIMMIPWFD